MKPDSRQARLLRYEQYYCGTAYDDRAVPWDQVLDARTSQPISFRLRKPSVILPYAKLVVDSLTRGLWSTSARPTAVLGTQDSAELDTIVNEARLYKVMAEATRRALTVGTGVVAWRIQDSRFCAEAWSAPHCTPVFKPGAFPVLASIDYRFCDTDADGTRVWQRQTVDEQSWKCYQPAEARGDEEPLWREDTALSVVHNLGFVPVCWFTVGERCGIDGTSVLAGLLSLFDEANYVASQSSRALYANLDPIPVLSGVAEADVGALLRGGGAWPLPLHGEAKLLESDGKHVTSAALRLAEIRRQILESAAVSIIDPSTHGVHSGVALQLLSLPMLAHLEELHNDVGDGAFVPLLQMMLAASGVTERGPTASRNPVGAELPSGASYHMIPVSLTWGSAFPSVPSDALVAAQAVDTAVVRGVLSRVSGAQYLASFFQVADVDADQQLVETEQAAEDTRADRVDRASLRAHGSDITPEPLVPEDEPPPRGNGVNA